VRRVEHRPIHAQARIASIFAALSAIVVAGAGLGICVGAMGSVLAISCLLEQSADRRSRGLALVAGLVCAAW
jgi:hypothetical protein